MSSISRSTRAVAAAAGLLLACARSSPESEEPEFASADAAVQALVKAARSPDPEAFVAVLGADADDVVHTGDPVADRTGKERFVKEFEAHHALVESGSPDRLTLEVGADRSPFPIPLRKAGGGWSFDVDAGREEILDRRIGRNELSAMQSMLAYVDAQREYYAWNPDNDALHHFASRLASTPGKHDGLYWDVGPNERQSPLGALFADAQEEGYTPGGATPAPYHGYYFRALTGQGSHADGGAYDYVAQDRQIGGFALVASPADYGNSGVMTFLVNHEGVVFQKDLGEKTAELVAKMKVFDPDETWTRVKE